MADDAPAIAWVNLADLGTITASSEAYPVSNLQDPHVQNRWRSTANAASIVIDHGALITADTVGLFGTTMTAAGTARLRLSTVDATGAAGDAYDSGTPAVVDSNYNAVVKAITAPVSFRYTRFDLSDAGGSYVESGRAFVGLRSQFDIGFDYGWSKGRTDRSLKIETPGGQTLIWADNSYRTLEVIFKFISAAQRDSIVEAIDIANGASTDVLFLIDPESTNLAKDSIWGLITDIDPVKQNFFDVFEKPYKIEERL